MSKFAGPTCLHGRMLAVNVIPNSFTTLFAMANFHSLEALLTANIAAPIELAATPFFPSNLFSFVASITAHKVAAVNCLRCPVALPSLSSEGAGSRVLIAEVRRAIDVNEI